MAIPALEIFPPFDLTSEMLFVTAFAGTNPLRRTFPGVPFLSLVGRTPLVLWFSSVSEGCYRDGNGTMHCLGGPGEALYSEVTVLAALRKRRLFCPAIYATSELSISIGKRYGMPKEEVAMDLTVNRTRFHSAMERGGCRTFVQAQRGGPGRLLGTAVSRIWPVWSWPVSFPSGSEIQARVQATPVVERARVSEGTLALPVPWLPEPVSFRRMGMFISQLRMQLPPP